MHDAAIRWQVGMGGAAVCYSYSCSKGAFAGVSIEGSLLTTRNDVNLNFYGGLPFTALPPSCFVAALRREAVRAILVIACTSVFLAVSRVTSESAMDFVSHL